MPALRNVRWELYAQKLSSGLSQIDAHEAAGYPRSSSNASTLARRPEIRDRVAEIIEAREVEKRDSLTGADLPNIDAPNGRLTPADVGITEEWLVRQLMANVKAAQGDAKYKEANTAIDMLGNYFGGLFSTKNTTDKSRAGDDTLTSERQQGLDDLMKRMAEGLSQTDSEDD